MVAHLFLPLTVRAISRVRDRALGPDTRERAVDDCPPWP
ncbi:hypothetical protein BQ8420_25745 [Nocardiopsis sp. JB363]|nr:hypothetical protein BQ8420_25745 [Nocardiopsis sp. JB363]